ncbi:MAG: recombinase family protein [Oscillospiraceae bacterium]|jgi:hypothetical protein|nr:recombinase family protein [Oscillospiraceae bacterium]
MNRGDYQSSYTPYGYQKAANGRLEIDEKAAENVRLIFKLFLEKRKIKEIIEILYKKEVFTPSVYRATQGKKVKSQLSESKFRWERSILRKILSDERYIGTYVAGKQMQQEVGSSRPVQKEESEWIKIPEHHPAIIEKSDFEAAQEILQRSSRSKRKSKQKENSAQIHALNRLNKPKISANMEEQIAFLENEKMQLYEQFLMQEINAETWLELKIELTNKISGLRQRSLIKV